jgi:ubiquinone/menaquinone biosynthesis C-methylase UbiE
MREVSGNDREWDAALAKRRRKIAWRYLRQRLLGWLPQRRRVEGNIKKQYAVVWTDIEFSSYDPTLKTPPINLWVWDQRRLFARVRVGARIRQYLLIKLLRSIKPRRVLEVGSGNGVNLLLLAGQFPEIEFHGIELTEHGVAAAHGIQARDVIPDNFVTFAPLPLKDERAFKRVSFRQGSADRLPFADGEFDLVYTCVAVEQMERIRDRALSEIARVSGRHVFFYEPFYDVNQSGLARRYVVARDYFRGAIGDLVKYGLEPVWATSDLPQKVNNNICAVYCRQRG